MNSVAFLDKLMSGELVEWKTLGEVADIGTGGSNRQDEDDSGIYPFYVRSKTILKSNTFQFDETAIIIPGEGGIGEIFHYAEGKYALHQRAYRIHIISGIINTKFLYYFMSSNFKRYILAKSVGATTISIRKPMLEEFPIPVFCPENPKKSLEIQAEIVRILDAFTESTAELTTELTAELILRQKQYNYYRTQLLSFEDCEVEWKTLGEVAEIRSGWGFPNSEQGHSEGMYPFYKVSDMNVTGNETIMSKANNYIDKKATERLGIKVAPPGTVIFPKIGAAVATNKKRILSVPSAYDNNVMGLIPTTKISSRFLFHWMQTINLSSLANDSGAVPSIRKSEMEAVLVPIPNPQVQANIVAVLDKLDSLTKSINDDLSHEIELRQKQYAYYRDLLLSFPKP